MSEEEISDLAFDDSEVSGLEAALTLKCSDRGSEESMSKTPEDYGPKELVSVIDLLRSSFSTPFTWGHARKVTA